MLRSEDYERVTKLSAHKLLSKAQSLKNYYIVSTSSVSLNAFLSHTRSFVPSTRECLCQNSDHHNIWMRNILLEYRLRDEWRKHTRHSVSTWEEKETNKKTLEVRAFCYFFHKRFLAFLTPRPILTIDPHFYETSKHRPLWCECIIEQSNGNPFFVKLRS